MKELGLHSPPGLCAVPPPPDPGRTRPRSADSTQAIQRRFPLQPRSGSAAVNEACDCPPTPGCACVCIEKAPVVKTDGRTPPRCTMTPCTALCRNSNSGSQLQEPRAALWAIDASNRCCSSPMCVPRALPKLSALLCCCVAALADMLHRPSRASRNKTTPTNPSPRFSRTGKMPTRPPSPPSAAGQSRIRISTTS